MNILHKIFNFKLKITPSLPLAWMADLCKIDDISAIELTTEKLANDFKNHTFQHVQNTEVLFFIDEKTHSIVEKITQYFMLTENIDESLKTRISNAAYLYHCQLFLTYYELSKNYLYPNKGIQHIVLSRALRNATQISKWQHHNHHHEPANLWSKIARIFKIAEQLSLLNAKIQSYSDQEPISLSSAYIQVCMLGSLQNSNFKPQQIEIANRLLSAWAAKISIDTTFDAKQHLFYVDTATNSPARPTTNFKTANTHRYWRFEEVNAKIDLYILSILNNISPEPLMMKEWGSSEYVLKTLVTLRAEWSLGITNRAKVMLSP
jgi:hypothetical protein